LDVALELLQASVLQIFLFSSENVVCGHKWATSNISKFNLEGGRTMKEIIENGQRLSVFDKVNQIEKGLNQLLPEFDRSGFIKILSKCRRFYEGKLYHGRYTSDKKEQKKRKRLELTEVERIVYQFLLERKLNPSTVYRWFLSTRLPKDIKDKLANKQIPVKKAMEIAANRRRVRSSNQGLLMMEEMLTIIGGL
jgi:hypothetical protein